MSYRKCVILLCSLLGITLICQRGLSEEKTGDSTLHTTAEIIRIMEESELVYTFAYYGGEDSDDDPLVLPPGRYRVERDSTGMKVMMEYEYSPVVMSHIRRGDSLFSLVKYSGAEAQYRKAWESGNGYYHPALICIGNCHFAVGLYDSAAVYFKKVIGSNFMSYQAHWFLSDSYFYLDRVEEAYRELLTAHLLNINHVSLFRHLKKLRKMMGRPWKEWVIKPRYQITEKDGMIVISAEEEWLGYAMVKAVWRYEPGYMQSMSGYETEQVITSTMEEREALLAYLATSQDERITGIIEDGFVDEMIYYEIIAREHPVTLVMLEDETFSRIIEYVDTYH
jgi:tetratricopeptide (TPR) repeat protein